MKIWFNPKVRLFFFTLKNLSRKLSPKFTVLHPTLQIGNEIKKLAIDDDQREMLCWYRALDFVDEDSRHELNAMPHRPYYIFFLIDLSTRNSILCSIFGENWHLYQPSIPIHSIFEFMCVSQFDVQDFLKFSVSKKTALQ